MTKYKIFSLLTFLFIASGCATENKGSTESSFKSVFSANLSERTNVQEAAPNSSVNCVSKPGSLFGFSRTCKQSGSLFGNILVGKKMDTSIDDVTEKNDLKSTQNCEIKANTLFGLSRTCESSDALSKSLSN